MRGSFLVTFFDEDGKGGDYIDIIVNGSIVKRIYNTTNNLYSCPLLIGDVVTVYFQNAPNFFSSQYSITRKDYTTDDLNGDMGIKETNIVTGSNLSEYTFTATTINSAYDFNYILDFSVDVCADIGNLIFSNPITGDQASTCEVKSNGDKYISLRNLSNSTVTYSGSTGSSNVGPIFKVNNEYQLYNDFNTITSLGTYFEINDIEIQTDGKLIVGGAQSVLSTIPGFSLNRLNITGELDPTFNRNVFSGQTGNGSVSDVVLQSDGKIVATGEFILINGTRYNQYVRLNSNGTIDNTYYSGGTGTGFNRVINCEIDTNTNKTYFFGSGITTFNGLQFGSILRLNTNGTLDTTFNGTGRGAFTSGILFSPALVNNIKVLSDGKILCVGRFDRYNGVVCPRGIVRLNQDGTLDTTFNTGGVGLTGITTQFIVQPTETLNEYENSYLIVAEFFGATVTYNGTTIPRNIFFLNEDGTLGNNTDLGTGMVGSPKTCKQLPSGGYLITGGITQFNGTPITNGGMVKITDTGLLQNC